MSYKSKLHKGMLSTESGRIAFAINLIDSPLLPYRIRRDWMRELTNGEMVELYDGIWVRQDGSYGYYYTVIKDDPYSNRYWYKVVPQFSGYDEMVAMLEAQSWHRT